jgi:hypothetical protein
MPVMFQCSHRLARENTSACNKLQRGLVSFNCYCHWKVLVVHTSQDGVRSSFIFSKKGITQGNALAMAASGIRVLPIISCLKEEFPDLKQPWYADNVGTSSSFANL